MTENLAQSPQGDEALLEEDPFLLIILGIAHVKSIGHRMVGTMGWDLN